MGVFCGHYLQFWDQENQNQAAGSKQTESICTINITISCSDYYNINVKTNYFIHYKRFREQLLAVNDIYSSTIKHYSI